MLIGPVFTREAVTLPRRPRLFVARTLYVAVLFGLMVTAWLILLGNQEVRNVGDWARFGGKLFVLIAPLQLAIVGLLSALVAAAAVAQEKDRRTLVLLLLTRLTNSELVLGRLLASMLMVLTMILATVPLLFITALLGGVSPAQILRVTAITLVSALVAGSLGSTVALWRDKTFQTLAMTALVLVFWLVGWEFVAAGAFGPRPLGVDATFLATAFSPWRAILAAAQPVFDDRGGLDWFRRGEGAFVLVATALTLLLNGTAIALVRVWNPSRQARPTTREENEAGTAAAPRGYLEAADFASGEPAAVKTRPVWDNPVLWREIRTWAYGRKILVVKAAYLAVFVACTIAVVQISGAEAVQRGRELVPAVAWPIVPLLVVSIILVGALSVTSITNERDGRAFDLLLVTDISPGEFIFGKLGGVLYNVKEMIVLPVGLCIYLAAMGHIALVNLAYLLGGLLVMYAFAAMLGIHAGLAYANSKSAIGASLGTLLFLFLGVATCMRIMVAFQGSFGYQLFAFAAFLFGGGIGLFVTLGARNPSTAIFAASLLAPFATFYVIVCFLLGQFGFMFLVTALTYGFATAAMLIPAIDEFDVATGRTTDGAH